MATKKCPNCDNDCPVASSSCKKCLHVFKSRKGSSNSFSSSSSSSQPASNQTEDTGGGGGNGGGSANTESPGRRHTGRITRSKPNFYDSLHVEEQMRQQKLLLRKQLKQSKSEDDGTGSGGAEDAGGTAKEKDTHKNSGEPEPKKRRRGRPPGIGVKKPTNAGRIAIHNKSSSNSYKIASNHNGNNCPDEDGKHIDNMKDEDIMSDITPEKALQYNIVLDEINRKWISASWKVS